MNNYTLQGYVLYQEPPKEKGRSSLMVLAIGRDKSESGGLIQAVNKVIVRIPSKLTHVAAKFNEGDFIEIAGNLQGRAHFSIGTGKPVPTINLVANSIQACQQSHLVPDNKVEKLLSCTWKATGLVKAIREPKKDGRPWTLYLQIERPVVRSKGSNRSQNTAVLAVMAYENAQGALSHIEPQMAVQADGHIHGLLRKMPIPNEDGEFEKSLEVGLVLRHIKQCAIVPKKLYESREERKQRQLAEKNANKGEIQDKEGLGHAGESAASSAASDD